MWSSVTSLGESIFNKSDFLDTKTKNFKEMLTVG